MRIVAAFVVVGLPLAAASVRAAEGPGAAQPPRTFAVWERPAAGVFLGSALAGDPNSEDTSPEIGLVFDTPVVFGLRIRADASRTTWLFEARDGYDRLTVRDAVTLESVRLSLLRVRHPGERTTGYAGLGYGGYRFSYRASPLRHPWRGGIHGVAGLEVTTPSQRYAVNGELRLHAINGTHHAPVASVVFCKLDAALGMKVRF